MFILELEKKKNQWELKKKKFIFAKHVFLKKYLEPSFFQSS